MRILVYGAGVQGCQLAHSLAQNKKNVVTLLARGEWKAVIDQKGLTIRHMLQRKTTVDRMQTIDVLAPEDVYDLVFVTVQAGQLADVLPILKANRSQYFIFVGNEPYAQEMLQAMQRPVDKIAFGFQNNAGRREHDRLVSVHMGMGMTIGGATAPLSGAFRLRLQAAFEGTHYKLTYYSDMDEWLKSHIAFILPCAYACYAVDGELSRTTVEQRRMIVDAAWECCEMLKAAGVPVNDAENTDRYREGTKQRKKQPFAQLALLATRQGEYGGRFLGVQLNQRQRLQHAIMQMGGHVRALLFALLQCLLVGESLQHRVRPRHHRHHDTDDHHESAGNNASRRGAPPRNADIMHIQCPSHENQCDAAQHRQQLRASRTKIHPCQCDAAQPYQQRKHNLDIRTGAGEQQSGGHQRETGQCHDGRFRSTLDGLGQ